MSNLQNSFSIVHIEPTTGMHVLMKPATHNESLSITVFLQLIPSKNDKLWMLDKENKLGKAAGKPSSQNQPQRAHPKVKR